MTGKIAITVRECNGAFIEAENCGHLGGFGG